MDMFEKLAITHPIIQAPMAGTATPELAAAVSNAGALGSLGLGSSSAATAATMIAQTRALTDRPFNVNVFVHASPVPDAQREQEWIDILRPVFAEFDASPPTELRPIYTSFLDDPEMLALLIETKPAIVSLHFGLPPAEAIRALKGAGITLLATATSLDEARAIEAAGIDGIVAQGIEAGGHRGMFDPDASDERLSTFALTRLLVKQSHLPVIAAGGIMDGAGIAAMLDLGAVAAQLGTAFVCCPESAADAAYREALTGPGAHHTRLTTLISGRPARALANRFTALQDVVKSNRAAGYPMTYDAGKALNAAAKAKGETGFGAQWAGQGAPLCREMPAADLVATLVEEYRAARRAVAPT